MMMKQDWTTADRISDAVVDICNREIAKSDPLQIFVGLLLGLRSFMDTAPANAPATFESVFDAVNACLTEVITGPELERQ